MRNWRLQVAAFAVACVATLVLGIGAGKAEAFACTCPSPSCYKALYTQCGKGGYGVYGCSANHCSGYCEHGHGI
jgi:hypothetical protein